MLVNTNKLKPIKFIRGISSKEFDAMLDFLEKEVTTILQSKTRFSFRDIAGNGLDWRDTPLGPLYLFYQGKFTQLNQKDPDKYPDPEKQAVKTAGKMGGRLLQIVLKKRPETFKQIKGGKIAEYQLI